jgi:hypothetical protein
MKSVAIIQNSSVILSDEMICEMGKRLRARLQEGRVECGPVVRDFKFYRASTFQASTRNGRFLVTISVGRDAELVTVYAQACRRLLKAWIPKRAIPGEWWQEFGEVYHRAVESEFGDVAIRWLTEDEWISNESYA